MSHDLVGTADRTPAEREHHGDSCGDPPELTEDVPLLATGRSEGAA